MTNRPRKRSTLIGAVENNDKIVHSYEFLNSARKRPQDFTRDRKMPFPKLIFFIVNMIRSSTQTALNNFFKNIDEEDIYMTQQSFSEARQKVKWTAFRDLFLRNVDYTYEHYYDKWQGYRLSAIDGTKLQLPSNEYLRQQFGGLGQDCTAPTAQGSALYDVLNDVIIDARIAPLKSDERTLALMHISTLCSRPSFDKECIIFDRGYPSFELIKILKKRGISFVMRVKRGFNKNIDTLGIGDNTVCLSQRGQTIYVRVLKFALPSGETECLITDILDNKLEDFKAIYFMRWPIETKYDAVKNKLEVENFSGLTINAIRQDFFATMFMANIASIACWEAQPEVDRVRELKDNAFVYRVNVNDAIGSLKDDFIEAILETNARKRSKKVKRILFLLGKSVVPKRPNRSIPRNKTPRDSKFRHNQKSNC